jgi:hypothetical protein
LQTAAARHQQAIVPGRLLPWLRETTQRQLAESSFDIGFTSSRLDYVHWEHSSTC